MKTAPIMLAARAKGSFALLKRAHTITRRYGLTSKRMRRALKKFIGILNQFKCGASFPLTAVVLKRNRDIIIQYLNQNIEFAVHGYTHMDYSQIPAEVLVSHLKRACKAFSEAGITVTGFRSPYLRRDAHIYTAIEKAGFSYVSNQPILWDIFDTDSYILSNCVGYQKAIGFYEPWCASNRPALPRLCSNLIEIPVSLPDDEMLLDRLGNGANGLVEKAWRYILSQTYRRGELFTIQLHPERIAGCMSGLSSVLANARTLVPSVWIARLDEIAVWWRSRAVARVETTDIDEGVFHVKVTGPKGTTVLARNVEIDAPKAPWLDNYWQVRAETFTVRSSRQPFIGISSNTSLQLVDFLRQQGYLLEFSEDSSSYSYYFDQADFAVEQERLLLTKIEAANCPLIKLGRWPNGARSALAITGDLDALTLWDYGLRLLGR